MRTELSWALALIVLAACSSEQTETAQSKTALASGRVWSGTLTYVDRSHNELNGGDVILSSTDDRRHAVSVKVNRNRAVMQASYSAFHRSVSVHRGEPWPCMAQTVEMSSGSGSGTVPATFSVDIFEDGTYSIASDIGATEPPLVEIRSTVSESGCGLSNSDSGSEFININQDFVLSGEADPESRTLTGNQITEASDGTGYTEWTWHLTAEEEDVELIVAVQDYDHWRPSASDTYPDEAPGDIIVVGVLLQTPDGRQPAARLRSVRFELSDVSHVPGYLMNAPLKASASKRADLDFDTVNEKHGLEVSGIERNVAVAAVDGLTADAWIASYDWGAFGRLRVTAELSDGRTVEGKLFDTGETEIRLPKSLPDSHIALGWLEQRLLAAPDDADDESIPIGDGHPGDGLTLYEEYRGFSEDFVRVEGDPALKDLFVAVRDLRSSHVRRGLALFQQISEIAVHDGLAPGDDEKRVINFNFSANVPHAVDQHAVVIEQGVSGNVSQAETELGGDPSSPVDCKRIRMMARTHSHYVDVDGTPKTDYEFDVATAHELAHCVNVWHHGDWPPSLMVQWFRDPASNAILERKAGFDTPIIVKHEIDSTISADDPFFDKIRTISVDIPNGIHSGDDQCIMRYAFANAYVASTFGERFYVGKEKAGHSLCTSPVGSGVNSADHLPQSRYGDAQSGLGRCAFLLCVNDRFARDPLHTH